ncbi:MAG: DUF4870 domain-containing protein [Syntrophotaleaceae bacterium]
MTERSHEESNWGTFCHLSALAGYFIPCGHIIGPLVIWLLKKDLYPSVDQHGKEALNFQISISIYALAAYALVAILIGIPLLVGLAIFNFIMIIIAAVKCKNDHTFRYPLSLRLLK